MRTMGARASLLGACGTSHRISPGPNVWGNNPRGRGFASQSCEETRGHGVRHFRDPQAWLIFKAISPAQPAPPASPGVVSDAADRLYLAGLPDHPARPAVAG